MIAIRPARTDDIAAILVLLDGDALPTADLATSQVAFWVGEEAGGLVAAIGLEQHGDAGLLRSLVVAAAHRGEGYAHRLVDVVEAEAHARGIIEMVLLTQTAETFFARLGYGVIPRNDAPDAVRASKEFLSLCPASATCMRKQL